MAKPVLRWAGGKASILNKILPFFPDFSGRYIEPFLGGGALAWHLRHPKAVLSDLNPHLIGFYKVLGCDGYQVVLSRYLELAEEYNLAPKTTYLELRRQLNSGGQSQVDGAALFLFLNKTSFNGLWRVNKKGHFNVPFGGRMVAPLVSAENLAALAEYLSQMDVELRNADFRPQLREAKDGDLVFLDPPYTPEATGGFTSYTASGFGLGDLKDLVALSLEAWRRGANIVVTNSAVKEHFPGFEHFETVRNTCVSGHKSARTSEKENVYVLRRSQGVIFRLLPTPRPS